MKTNLSLLTFLFFAALTFTSCTMQAQNRISSETYRVSSFNAIVSNSVGNIHFSQGSSTSVRAEGNQETIDNLRISVKDGKLVIDMAKRPFKRFNLGRKKLDIYISSPTLSVLQMNGVGNVTLEGNINTPQLEIISDGVGNLKAEELSCENITIDSEGVGNITLAGKTNSLSISSDGVGNVHAEELIAKNATVTSDGIGNVSFYASESMDVSSDGVGNVTYYGNPKNKNITKDGVGKLKPGN